MILFPAIDILDGRAVRLKHGDKSQATVYGEPLDFAEMWAEAGAEYLHVVDLSGAFSGESGIDDVIREIKSKFGIPIESGGGLRSIEDIARRLDAGADRVIIGTMAICHPDEFALAVYKFGNKIVAGIDAKDGYFAVSGWTEQTDVKAVDFGKKVRRMGLEYALFTDISKDGTLSGVNAEQLSALADATRGQCNIIASGGVHTIEDIRICREMGLYGTICGKSLYKGTLDLREAIAEAQPVNQAD